MNLIFTDRRLRGVGWTLQSGCARLCPWQPGVLGAAEIQGAKEPRQRSKEPAAKDSLDGLALTLMEYNSILLGLWNNHIHILVFLCYCFMGPSCYC